MAAARISWPGAIAVALVAAAAIGLALGVDSDRDGIPDRRDACRASERSVDVDTAGCSATQRAFQRGVAALRQGNLSDPSMVWILRKLLDKYPDAVLQVFVDHAARQLAHHPSARLINTAAPPVNLPADPGRGIQRFALYVQAPFGQPRARAQQFVTDFLASDGNGYVLTHQLLVALWAEEQGLLVAADLRARRADIEQRIAAEHDADERFSDLFAERAAFLLAFTSTAPVVSAGWSDAIVSAQGADGRWTDTTGTRLSYDGQDAAAVHEWSHTTSLSLVALGLHSRRAQ